MDNEQEPQKPEEAPRIPVVKNKELTKQKLIDAVGAIVQDKGFSGLGVNKVAKKAKVHKKLIYRYFTSLEGLIEAYVRQKDYWMLTSGHFKTDVGKTKGNLSESLFKILEDQFDFFYSEADMQRTIIWEINGSDVMKGISVAREELAEKFLKLTDDYFEKSEINFRGLSAILSSAIYYMVLHAPISPYCGLDLRIPEHRLEFKRTIRQIINWAFEHAKMNRQGG